MKKGLCQEDRDRGLVNVMLQHVFMIHFLDF